MPEIIKTYNLSVPTVRTEFGPMGDAKAPVDDLTRYKSIKEVRAGEITEVVAAGCYVQSSDPSQTVLRIFEPNMTARYEPKVGDFWIVYPDGYQAISPRRAFLEGYVGMNAAEDKKAL